uniref:Putative restriction endonuclease domain-containing protein n=1 Tax=uncultured Armatimonadetes bacterium TaxID=157466 RepID=A0A6J4K271_9BACT|nr:hypothetical protein AVDCRST_MAG63-4610 [uncultured Armatimonadetes bacterium]
MSSLAQPLYTVEEYLALEREAEYKSEFVNGQILAMSGASRAHNLIATNVSSELRVQLKGRPCETYSGDMRVQVSDTGMYAYPDVVVVCGEPRFEDTHPETLTNPTVIVEVLSASTEAHDRGAKFAHYRRLLSLQEYVLIAQDRCSVERFVRRGGEWLFSEATALSDTVALTSIDCRLALAEVYDRVAFPPDAGIVAGTGEPR